MSLLVRFFFPIEVIISVAICVVLYL